MATSMSSPDTAPASSLPSCLSDKRVQIGMICVNLVLAFVSFFIFVPIVMSKGDSDGQCLLYGDNHGFGHVSVCDYCISVAVFLLIMCVARAVVGILGQTKYSTMLSFIHSLAFKVVSLFVDLVMLVILLVVASMISAGFSHLCNKLFNGRSKCDSPYGLLISSNNEVNNTFYDQLSVAEGAAWFTFCLWFLLLIIEMLLFWKEGSFRETTLKAKSAFGTDV